MLVVVVAGSFGYWAVSPPRVLVTGRFAAVGCLLLHDDVVDGNDPGSNRAEAHFLHDWAENLTEPLQGVLRLPYIDDEPPVGCRSGDMG